MTNELLMYSKDKLNLGIHSFAHKMSYEQLWSIVREHSVYLFISRTTIGTNYTQTKSHMGSVGPK